LPENPASHYFIHIGPHGTNHSNDLIITILLIFGIVNQDPLPIWKKRDAIFSKFITSHGMRIGKRPRRANRQASLAKVRTMFDICKKEKNHRLKPAIGKLN
jgi:hypothetical protein